MERRNFCKQLKCLLVNLEGGSSALMSVAGSSAQNWRAVQPHCERTAVPDMTRQYLPI